MPNHIHFRTGKVNLGCGWSIAFWQRGLHQCIRIVDIITPHGWAAIYYTPNC